MPGSGVLIGPYGPDISASGVVIQDSFDDCGCCCETRCYVVWRATPTFAAGATGPCSNVGWTVSFVSKTTGMVGLGRPWEADGDDPCKLIYIMDLGCYDPEAEVGCDPGQLNPNPPEAPAGSPGGDCAGGCYSEWRAVAVYAPGSNCTEWEWSVQLIRQFSFDGYLPVGWQPDTPAGCSQTLFRFEGCRSGTPLECPFNETPPTPPSGGADHEVCCQDCPCVQIVGRVFAGWKTLATCCSYEFESNGECCVVHHRFTAEVSIDGDFGMTPNPAFDALQFRSLLVCPGEETPCDMCAGGWEECGSGPFNASSMAFNLQTEVRCVDGATQVRARVALATQNDQCTNPGAFAWDSGWVTVGCDATMVTLGNNAGVGAVCWQMGSITLLLEPA